MILSPTVTYTPTQMPVPGEDQPDALDVEVVDLAEGKAQSGPDKGGLVVQGEDAVALQDAQVGTSDVLADVAPATDDEIKLIEAQSVKKGGATRSSSSRALAVRDPLAAYMSEVRRHPLLTREEEHALAVRWVEDGDKEAAKKLATSNLRLVVKIANEYRRGYQNLLDLVQEGNLGLLKAVQKFDPYRGVKLSTYSGWWIRAYILKHILNNWRLVKIGTTQNQRKLFFNLRKQQEALAKAGVDATPERIAEALDVSPKEVVEMQKRMGAPDKSLNAPLRGDEDGGARTGIDMLEDAHEDVESSVGDQEFKSLLSTKLRRFGATLSGREAEIFSERLLSDEPVTLQHLGTRWGVSRERARQIEKRMVLRLRKFLTEELGDSVQIALGHDD